MDTYKLTALSCNTSMKVNIIKENVTLMNFLLVVNHFVSFDTTVDYLCAIPRIFNRKACKYQI